MSQSCDLNDYENDDDVILCPRINFLESPYKSKDDWGKLVSGKYISTHLLNRCEIEGFTFDYQIVVIKKIFTVPLGYVKEIARQKGNRIRMLPPYREYLAQAFAWQFMRIGLPIDIPKNYPYQ